MKNERRTRKDFSDASERLRAVSESALLASQGQSQEQIANALQRPQRTISRLLKEARDLGILGPPVFNADKIADQKIKGEYSRLYGAGPKANELSEHFKKWYPDGTVRVTICSAGADTPGKAAYSFSTFLENINSFGIMYGWTVRNLLSWLANSSGFDRNKGKTVTCIPLCGDPLYSMHSTHLPLTASQLSEQFYDMFHGKKHESTPTLTGVPAYVASKYAIPMQNSEFRDWEVFTSIPGYAEIFGDLIGDQHTGMVKTLDAVVTGVGIVQPSEKENDPKTGTLIRERLIQENKDEIWLGDSVIGDIGGLLIQGDKSKESDEKVKTLNAGWTGVTHGDLFEIAERARKHNAGGVLVIALLAKKAPVIRELIKRGLVNELIISSELASELVSLSD